MLPTKPLIKTHPFSTILFDKQNPKNKTEGAFAPSMKMVAGAVRICKWKYKNQAIRQSSEFVISWISRKKEFTRGAMERTLGFSLGQAEWWIKELRKKGIIKRTKRFEHKLGRGNRQAIYKYVE